MKLLNRSLLFFSLPLLLVMAIWAVVFYINILSEIKGSIDEGLENYVRVIVDNAYKDSTILTKKYFDESFFTVKKLKSGHVIKLKPCYLDTIIYMQDADDKELEPEPVRLMITHKKIKDEYYEIRVANSMVEEDDLVKTLLWDVVWLYLIIVASTIMIISFIQRRLWRPFYQILDQVKSFRLGRNMKTPNVRTNTMEFQHLQEDLKEFLEQSENLFEQQKEFIGNAAHELNSPLAAIQNKLELILENEELSTVDADRVESIFSMVRRMIKLNKSLLLLSKIDSQYYFDNQDVNINELVIETIQDFEEIAMMKNVKISMRSSANLKVYMDPTLSLIILNNLVKNAIYHNINEGLVEVIIEDRKLIVSNSADGAELDRAKIFDRFYKSDVNRTGLGLGLAIVKAIVDLYDYDIEYKKSDNKHYFTIFF